MTPFGFFVAAGGVTAILWLKCHHRQIGVSENEFWIGTWLTFVGAIVGAKALFVILGWHHYATGELHFWLNFGTGFIFFGGLAGALITAGIFAWWRGLSFWQGTDYFAVALPLGHAIGRVGCFVNGCCPSRPPHPVQLYESGGLLAISLVCFFLLNRLNGPGSLAARVSARIYFSTVCSDSFWTLCALMDDRKGSGDFRISKHLPLRSCSSPA